MEPFSAHNIRLNGRRRTIPNSPLLADSPLVRSVLRTLHVAFEGELAGRTIVDIGCLEGGWTVEFARAGLDALGIDVRRLNIDKCEYVNKRLGLSNLRFTQDDARNLGQHGTFDAVFCSGLLYHLDYPAAYLRDLATATRRILILGTHYAPEYDTSPEDGTVTPAVDLYKLSEVEIHGDTLGRWFREYDEDESQEAIEEMVWTSYGNHRSFWMLKPYLIQELRNVGFSPVYEQFDCHENLVTGDLVHAESWGMFVAYRDVPPLEPAAKRK